MNHINSLFLKYDGKKCSPLFSAYRSQHYTNDSLNTAINSYQILYYNRVRITIPPDLFLGNSMLYTHHCIKLSTLMSDLVSQKEFKS